MARQATKEEVEKIDKKNIKPEEVKSGQELLNPKSRMVMIQGEEIEIKKWNLGQLTELGTDIANLALVLQDAQGDAGMVIAILSSKLPLVNKVCQMTLRKDEDFCKEIDGDELMDIYEVCSELNKSFFLRFKALLPEGIINLATNQGTSSQISQETEMQEVGTIGSTSSIGLQAEDTSSTQENIPTEVTEESSNTTTTNSSGS